MLAQRTQKLIEEIQPDAVIVQTSEEWWDHAKLLKYVESQEEMNKYGKDLDRHLNVKTFEEYWATRKYIFLARLYLYNWFFRFHFRLGFDFHFMRPGLEIKKACEAAEKVGAKIKFVGPEMN